MGKKRGVFEREALWNFCFLAILFGMSLLATLIAAKILGQTEEARRAATARAKASAQQTADSKP